MPLCPSGLAPCHVAGRATGPPLSCDKGASARSGGGQATRVRCDARELHLPLLGHRSPRVSERGLGAGCAPPDRDDPKKATTRERPRGGRVVGFTVFGATAEA